MSRNDAIEDDLFPFYALDALSDEERAQVDAYVAANPDARARLAKLMETSASLPASVTPLQPGNAVKADLMSRVTADAAPSAATAAPRRATSGRQSPRPTRSWWQVLAPAFAGLAAVALVIGGLALWQMSRQVDDLRQEVAALRESAAALESEVGLLRAENETLRNELSVRDDLLALYRRPGAVTIAIGDSTGQNPDSAGTLTMDPTTGEATLSVVNLPPTGSDETYQAWLIIGETPVSAGVFAVSQDGHGTLAIPGALPGTFDAVGVSREPAGGSEQPTPGNIVLLGGASG